MLGIDIYRYQTVTDPTAVANAGVRFAYVKGTDGGEPAPVRADVQVRQMRSVGIPVGLYHYAQLSPSPERQAEVLLAEVDRLGAHGLPPALDLELPWQPGPAARGFAYAFLTRLREHGFRRVTLYANTSMLNGIDVDTLDVPGLVIWEANYGPNDGRRHTLPRRPWQRHVHQYTSVGTLPGILGRVDLNDTPNLAWLNDTERSDDVALAQEPITFHQDAGGPLGAAAGKYTIPANEALGWIHNYAQGAYRDAAIIRAQNTAILAAVTNDGDLTAEQFRAMVAEELDKRPVVVDVDEALIAEELQARGITGVSAAQLVEILASVRLSPQLPPVGSGLGLPDDAKPEAEGDRR